MATRLTINGEPKSFDAPAWTASEVAELRKQTAQ
jgi:hypothetical protein